MVSIFDFVIFSLTLHHFGTSFAIKCPQYWTDATQVGLGCLFFDTTNQMDWPEAQESCKSMANTGHLVEIFSEEQQSFLVAKAFEIQALTGQSNPWWIGLTYDLSNEFWIWSYSQTAPNYTSWAYEEPIGVKVSIYALLEDVMVWNWYNCPISCKINPICQINQ